MKARELGINIGTRQTGLKNCITDVEGVKVGHVTLDHEIGDSGKYACTGVTAVLPHGGNLFKEKVTAASYVLNGFGKTIGLVQITELGVLESPIMLTNTFGIPAVSQGTLQYMLEQNEEIGEKAGTINIVVGECNDSYLNSLRELPIKPEHAIEAIQSASPESTAEGAVGAGKGMVCFGYKGGIGTASRIIQGDGQPYTIGCLVLTNFGSREDFSSERYLNLMNDKAVPIEGMSDGSIIMVLATDAPVSDRQLSRLAKRCGIGLGRTGSHFSHGSGDIVIAFSTAKKITHESESGIENRIQLREEKRVMNELFASVAEATEEAIINSLMQAETTTGRDGHIVHSLLAGK